MTWFPFADPTKPTQAPGAAPSPVDAQVEEEDPTAGDEAYDMMMSLMPWGVSFLLHVGLVILMIFIVWSAAIKNEEEKIIVPSAVLSKKPGTPLRQKTTRRPSKTRRTAARRAVSRSPSQTQSDIAAPAKGQMKIIGALGGGGGKPSAFAAVSGGGASFETQFFGLGGNARKIIYIVDASGSLIDTFPFVIMELKRSISELKDAQSFTVIFFQGEDHIEVPPPRLKKATSENKLKVIEWVDPAGGNVIPTGLSNPVKAITRALQYQPELIFLLSDNITGQGRYEVDQKQLLARIEHANSRSRTVINTIQFLYPDRLTQWGLKPTLEEIAEQHKGQYTYIDGRELGIE